MLTMGFFVTVNATGAARIQNRKQPRLSQPYQAIKRRCAFV
jgi:hypothetical protein